MCSTSSYSKVAYQSPHYNNQKNKNQQIKYLKSKE